VGISGSTLTLSMYPYTPYEIYAKELDQNYNAVMLAYNDTVSPWVTLLATEINNVADAELQQYLEALPGNFISQLAGINQALIVFCCNGVGAATCTTNNPQCLSLFGLRNQIRRLGRYSTAPQLRQTILSILGNFATFNPFNVLGGQSRIDRSILTEYIRGGVRQNNTNKYPLVPPSLYYHTVALSLQNDFQFEEYVIVSDGDSASTASLFASTATQIWANRVLSGAKVPLTTVTFGGTKDPSDTAVTAIPASVQGVRIEFPIITSGLIMMTEFLLPSNASIEVAGINEYYQKFLPPPAYFGESLPTMPVQTVYNFYMEPGALPLQYVKIVGDEHIQQFYPKSSLSNSEDLAALYKATARVGFKSTMPQEDSLDDSLLPPESSKDDAANDTAP
jgi:hypothetical protein